MSITVPPGGYGPPPPPPCDAIKYTGGHRVSSYTFGSRTHCSGNSLGGCATPEWAQHQWRQLPPCPTNQAWPYAPDPFHGVHICGGVNSVPVDQHMSPPGVSVLSYFFQYTLMPPNRDKDPSQSRIPPQRCKRKSLCIPSPRRSGPNLPNSPLTNIRQIATEKQIAESLIMESNLSAIGRAIPILETSEQIEAWITERKKKYPARPRVAPQGLQTSSALVQKKKCAAPSAEPKKVKKATRTRAPKSKLDRLKSVPNSRLLSDLSHPDAFIQRIRIIQCLNHLVTRRLV